MNQSTLAVNGTDIYLEDSGEKELPAILCLHSLFLDRRMFGGFTAAAAGAFRVIRPDFRGQGRSAPADAEIIEVDTWAADVIALIEELGLDRPHLLVQSMGGDVGLRVAHQRPDLVRSIGMLGSSARSEPADQLGEFREWVGKIAETGFQGDELKMTMEIMFGATTRGNPAKHDIVELWRERIAALPTALVPAISGVIERPSAVELLPEIELPVLVISGDEDIARPPEWAQEVADGLPQAELWSLQGVGHSPILEVPEVVLPRLLEFFKA